MKDDHVERTGVDSDIELREPNPFSTKEKERAWQSAMNVIRDLGEDLERRRKVENHLENELVVRDALIFMVGFGVAYLILEGLRWLLS